MVTHDQEEALSMADRVVVMNHGVIEQIGTPQQIYREPASAFVADFVGKVNVISAVAEGGGRFRVGALVLTGAVGAAAVAPGTRVRLYLRPEDVVIDGAAAGQANAAHRDGDQGRVSRRLLPRHRAGRRSRGAALADQHLAAQHRPDESRRGLAAAGRAPGRNA